MSKPLVCGVMIASLLFSSCWPRPEQRNVPNASPTATATPSTEVNIKVPSEGSKVKQTEMVRGTSQNIPAGNVIWMVVFVHDVGRYFPQNQPADVRANGDWDSVTYFGIPSDKSLKFDAIAVLADGGGQLAFNNYLAEARDKNAWPGLERLPEGAKIYGRVSVTRE